MLISGLSNSIKKVEFNPNTIEQELLEKASKDSVVLIICEDNEQTKQWINNHVEFVRPFICDGYLFVIKL